MKNKLSLLPTRPGCYLMKNKDGIIIYVGKAKNLKRRVNSYFNRIHTGKTAKLVSEIVDFEYIVVDSEVESLILEMNLIKQYDPKYNILLRDDKSYPYIELTDTDVPRLKVVRNINRKKKYRYLYGPYPNVYAARKTVNLLNRMYPLRKCTTYQKTPCLYYHIGQCLGYCTHQVDQSKIEQMKQDIIKFLNGDHTLITAKINEEMKYESSQMHYEKAQELKDLLDYINITLSHQQVELKDNTNRDIFGYYVSNGYMSVQVFFIRNAKIVERHFKIFPLVDDESSELTRYIAAFYSKNVLKPKEVLVPSIVDDILLSEYLNISIKKPIKGLKKKLIDMANDNAKIVLDEKFELIKMNEKKTIEANDQLREILKLEKLYRIELFDNAHLFGTYNVSGMVVFKDGTPSKKDYRKFKISIDQNDDYGTMREVLYRRYFRVLRDNLEKPDLIIVDGGVGQVNVAREVINSLNIDIPIIGLKKDDHHATSQLLAFEPLEEINIDKKSELFYLLERMQDEVHNYTINYHKQIRSKGSLASVLDNVDGIGIKRKQKLIRKYQNIKNMQVASLQSLEEILPHNVAINLKDSLKNINTN